MTQGRSNDETQFSNDNQSAQINTEQCCYYCGKAFNDTNCIKSKEHIIPNALGGRIKADILCKKCNSKVGNNIDAKLVKSLSFFSNTLNQDRDRGKNQSIKGSVMDLDKYDTSKSLEEREATNVYREPDGKIVAKPEVTIYEKDGKSYYQIKYVGYDAKNVSDITNGILNSLAKKNNWTKEMLDQKIIEYNELINKSARYIQNPIFVSTRDSLGGENWLAIIKIAIGFYCAKGSDRKYIQDVLYSLKSDNYRKIATFYFPQNLPNESIYHTLVTVGNKKEKLLYSIVSLYGVMNGFVLLNNDYNGDDFTDTYCYDLRNNKEVEYNFVNNVKASDVENIFSTKDEHWSLKMQQYFGAIGYFMWLCVGKDYFINNTPNAITEKINYLAKEDKFYSLDMFCDTMIDYIKTLLVNTRLSFDEQIWNDVFKNDKIYCGMYLNEKMPLFVSSLMSKLPDEIFLLTENTQGEMTIDVGKILSEKLNKIKSNYPDAEAWINNNLNFDECLNALKQDCESGKKAGMPFLQNVTIL